MYICMYVYIYNYICITSPSSETICYLNVTISSRRRRLLSGELYIFIYTHIHTYICKYNIIPAYI